MQEELYTASGVLVLISKEGMTGNASLGKSGLSEPMDVDIVSGDKEEIDSLGHTTCGPLGGLSSCGGGGFRIYMIYLMSSYLYLYFL